MENKYQPAWRNVSDERIEDPEKAKDMANVENEYREKAQRLGDFAAAAASDESHPLAAIGAQINYEDAVRTVQDGAKAVESAGQEYDARQAQPQGVDLVKH